MTDELIRKSDALAACVPLYGWSIAAAEELEAAIAALPAVTVGAKPRKTFPILKGEGAKIDFQLVADHAEQARSNHYQSVERLAERGGLSWCELHAVLHNRKFEKMETNEAMIACRSLEARYLAALEPAAPSMHLHANKVVVLDDDLYDLINKDIAPPNEKLRQMYADYRKAIGSGRLIVDDPSFDPAALRAIGEPDLVKEYKQHDE